MYNNAYTKILYSNWLPFIFFLLALALRLYVNLYFNPFDQHLRYDMLGYHLRSNELLDNPFSGSYFLAFHPSGTDVLLALFKLCFGRDNFTAMGVFYSILGTGAVIFSYYIAKKVSRFLLVPLLVLIISTININHIFVGSYLLSQPLHGFFMAFGIWTLLKLLENKCLCYALATSFLFGICILIRPDSLVLIFLLILLMLIKREYFNFLNTKLLLGLLIPFMLCLAFGIVKAKIHTGSFGFISTNGQYNLVFGRCHCKTYSIEPSQPGANAFAGNSSIPLLFLHQLELDQDKLSYPLMNKLLPAKEVVIKYDGDLKNTSHHLQLARECISTTGILKQVYYSIVNISFLWRFVLWPANEISYVPVKYMIGIWDKIFNFYIMIGSFLALGFLFRINRQNLGLYILALNYLSLLIVSALIFGEIRLRVPYDFNLIILALEFYGIVILKIKSSLSSWPN